MRRVGSEEEMCLRLAAWLRHKYPDLLWHFDYGSGLKMTMGQAMRQKRLNNRSWPDLFLAATLSMKLSDGDDSPQPLLYAGLFLELKREGTRLKKRDGSWSSDHIAEQAAVLDQLADQGYIAQFACGFDQAVEVIDSYMGAV